MTTTNPFLDDEEFLDTLELQARSALIVLRQYPGRYYNVLQHVEENRQRVIASTQKVLL